MRESTVERKIGEFCKAHGITYQKQSGSGNVGMADRLLMRQGKVAFLEVKAPGKIPTKLQLRYLVMRADDGFDAGWFDDVDKAREWIQGVFKL